MSWWVSLRDEEGSIPEVSPHTEGGTIQVGGCPEADLNVTYNYGKLFRFPELHGRLAKDTIPLLQEAVEKLGTEQDDDYWNPTSGNVGYACSILLAWAKLHPEYAWHVE